MSHREVFHPSRRFFTSATSSPYDTRCMAPNCPGYAFGVDCDKTLPDIESDYE